MLNYKFHSIFYIAESETNNNNSKSKTDPERERKTKIGSWEQCFGSVWICFI